MEDAIKISTIAQVSQDTFINATYPVNGQTTHTETTTITVQRHDTGLIVATACMSAIFLGLSAIMFFCHRKH